MNNTTATLKKGDKVEMQLTPRSASAAGCNWYSSLPQWHVHLTDANGVEYYWLTAAEQTVNELMQKVGTAVEMKFIVAGIRQSENCIRIKNVRIV